MLPAHATVPPTNEVPVMERSCERSRPQIISRLSTQGIEQLARAIRELGWNDESIADAAHIAEHTGLVTAARNGKLIEVSQQQQIPLYRLIAFLGLSKDDFVAGDQPVSSRSQVA